MKDGSEGEEATICDRNCIDGMGPSCALSVGRVGGKASSLAKLCSDCSQACEKLKRTVGPHVYMLTCGEDCGTNCALLRVSEL